MTGPNQCHDITVYPAIGLAGGACGGYGFLLDIRDVANPKRLEAAADENMAFWHSATFNNDGSKILFSDEWGGGAQPRCRDTDKPEWGADALFTLVNNKMTFKSYYKLSAPQTAFEYCVAHNGSLVPIPGRDVMVQAWYQGGISGVRLDRRLQPEGDRLFHRGPMDATRLVMAGSWSAYYYNGYVVSSEIARGLDILELTPSGWLSQNELDAAKTVRFDYLNSQEQPKIVARELSIGSRLSRSAHAIERPPVHANHRRADRACASRKAREAAAADGAPAAGHAADQGHRRGHRSGQGADAGRRGQGSGLCRGVPDTLKPEFTEGPAVTHGDYRS